MEYPVGKYAKLVPLEETPTDDSNIMIPETPKARKTKQKGTLGKRRGTKRSRNHGASMATTIEEENSTRRINEGSVLSTPPRDDGCVPSTRVISQNNLSHGSQSCRVSPTKGICPDEEKQTDQAVNGTEVPEGLEESYKTNKNRNRKRKAHGNISPVAINEIKKMCITPGIWDKFELICNLCGKEARGNHYLTECEYFNTPNSRPISKRQAYRSGLPRIKRLMKMGAKLDFGP
jgi:hypothetical protein